MKLIRILYIILPIIASGCTTMTPQPPTQGPTGQMSWDQAVATCHDYISRNMPHPIVDALSDALVRGAVGAGAGALGWSIAGFGAAPGAAIGGTIGFGHGLVTGYQRRVMLFETAWANCVSRLGHNAIRP